MKTFEDFAQAARCRPSASRPHESGLERTEEEEVEIARRVEIMARRHGRGLDVLDGKPLEGRDARHWLRTFFGMKETKPWPKEDKEKPTPRQALAILTRFVVAIVKRTGKDSVIVRLNWGEERELIREPRSVSAQRA